VPSTSIRCNLLGLAPASGSSTVTEPRSDDCLCSHHQGTDWLCVCVCVCVCVQIAWLATGCSECRSYTSMSTDVSLQKAYKSGPLIHMSVIICKPVHRILQFSIQSFVRSLLPLWELFCEKAGRAREVSAKAARFQGKWEAADRLWH
jgi:hypothetical protein